jgi:hypothetical protein
MMNVLLLLALQAPAAPDKDRLRTALKDAEVRGDWVYDDLDAGLARAKAEGKPAFVVLRCVP